MGEVWGYKALRSGRALKKQGQYCGSRDSEGRRRSAGDQSHYRAGLMAPDATFQNDLSQVSAHDRKAKIVLVC